MLTPQQGVDGSSLPDSASVDPALTIVAFASQSAEYLNHHWLT
jgi:choline dehydrogenase-like flavoprotein